MKAQYIHVQNAIYTPTFFSADEYQIIVNLAAIPKPDGGLLQPNDISAHQKIKRVNFANVLLDDHLLAQKLKTTWVPK